mmetsp:Transcript_70659/g.165700  ORF Transcript_70659/g.165700 Transcript_70659/m.165700 type:complete len:443 (-) Transcript_70659:106-1434(-)
MAKAFDIAVVGGGLAAFHAVDIIVKAKKATVAFVHGFTFQEFPIAAATFLTNPADHEKWTCGEPEKWQKFTAADKVEYFLSSADMIDCDNKEITLMNKGPHAGAVISYKVLIVATGQKSPMILPTAGMSLSERISEVQACGAALKAAKTVVFNGAGLVGLEMCGDFRAKMGYGARVILLTRSGKVLDSDFGDKAMKPDPKVVSKVTDVLTNKFKIEIKTGSIADPKFSQPFLSAGSLTLDSGETIDFDVYIPCFSLGPGIEFMKSSKAELLDSRGAIIANSCLQSTAHPEIFGVGVTTVKITGHPMSMSVTAAGEHCGKQALLALDGKPATPYKNGGMNLPHPMNVKIGHGPGGYMIWTALPAPAKVCCCLPCGGGYPCCPPPCCWCCLPGCSGACGSCCGPAEGEGPAIFMPSLLAKFPGAHGYKGLGSFGTEVPKQETMA